MKTEKSWLIKNLQILPEIAKKNRKTLTHTSSPKEYDKRESIYKYVYRKSFLA